MLLTAVGVHTYTRTLTACVYYPCYRGDETHTCGEENLFLSHRIARQAEVPIMTNHVHRVFLLTIYTHIYAVYLTIRLGRQVVNVS